MDIVKVIIENWPETNYLTVYVPIIIALIALGVSIFNVRLTRKSFIESHRPYVWGLSFAVLEDRDDKKVIVPQPYGVLFRVTNSPAKILRLEVRVTLLSETLYAYTDVNLVRFPDERSQWHHLISPQDFEKMMERAGKDKDKLQRLISIDYSSLDGGRIYHYELQQSFISADYQWKDASAKAD